MILTALTAVLYGTLVPWNMVLRPTVLRLIRCAETVFVTVTKPAVHALRIAEPALLSAETELVAERKHAAAVRRIAVHVRRSAGTELVTE